MAKVLMPLAIGFEEIEALSVVDIMRRGGVEIVTASIHDTVLSVEGAHGIEVKADALYADVADEEYDAIILPGGGKGTENLKAFAPLLERLRRQKSEERLICAICAAPVVLVTAGVLDEGQQVTCYPSCQVLLKRPWVNQPVVVHNNVVTSQGPGTAMLFGLVILKMLLGDEVAEKVAVGLITPGI